MNIHEINNLYKAESLSSQKINKDNRFKQIFDEKLEGIQATAAPPSLNHKIDVLNQSDKILHLLDVYAAELTDNTKTLKDIEPLVQNIKHEVDLIQDENTNKVFHDNELKKIINDVTITANVAISKFQRGDYL